MKKISPLSTQEPKMYKRISEEYGTLEIGVRRRGSSSRASNENISSFFGNLFVPLLLFFWFISFIKRYV
jgi:hypothetical protein